MKILAKTADISREEWLKLRTQGIGGSDVSIIAGINKFKSVFQLWLEKTGIIEPEEGDSEYTHFGTVLEPVVRKEFMERTGIKVRAKNCIMQHDEYPFMICNLDGVIYENGELCIFEAKTASAYKEKEWQDNVPPEYQLQIQHYMAITGAKKTYIAALIGGNKFVYHVVERDEEVIELIIQLEKKFWEENVVKNLPPEIDGSNATAEYLNEKYSISVKNEIRLPEQSEELLEEYDKITSALEKLNYEKTEIVNRLKDMLGENESGVIQDRIVKWSNVSKTGFDSKRLKEEMQDIYEKYITHTQYRRFVVV